jgi:hypothetical protein
VKRTTGLEPVSPEWRSDALPAELRPREHARLESNQRPLPSQGSAHPLSYGRTRASGRSRTCAATVRRVRASVDTTEAGKVETAGVEPAPPRCKRGAHPHELHPQRRECGRVESNHHSAGRPGYSRLSSPVLSVREGGVAGRARTDAARITTANAAATPRPPRNGDDRIRTGGLSPDKRALCALELRPHGR